MATYRHYRGDEDDEYLDNMKEILGTSSGQLPPRPTQLLPHVLQGSQRHAENLALLRKLGVTHVLNAAGYKGPRKEPECNPYKDYGIVYLEFKADDDDCYNMAQHFPAAFHFLDEVASRKGVCLVHCALGVNRSSCVTAAYLLHHCRWPLLEVVRFLKSERGLVLTNLGFQRQLVGLARRLHLLDHPGRRAVRAHSLGPHVEAEHSERSPRSRYKTDGDLASVRRIHTSPLRVPYRAKLSDADLARLRTLSLGRRAGFRPAETVRPNSYGSSGAYATFRSYLLGGGN